MFHKVPFKKATQFILLAFFISFNFQSHADSLLTIIIDDIGNELRSGTQALALHGDITYAILPYSRHAKKLSSIGLQRNKELILHSPMQSIDSRLITKQTLHIHMTENEFKQQFQEQLDIFPFIKGVNNHMGSLLTTHPAYMKMVMQELKSRGDLFFIDSRTTARTIALQLAKEIDIPSIQRDIFLDTDKSYKAIDKQFTAALKLSKKQGHATVIAHPYKNTLKLLKKRLPELLKINIKLVSASKLIKTLAEKDHEKSTDTTSARLRRTRSHYNN